MKKIFILILILLIIPSTVSAAGYYISPDGSASWNQCTNIDTPCSLDTANQNANAGDTVYLREGIYSITSSGIDPFNSGISGAPITYTSYNNEHVNFIGAGPSSTCIDLNSDYGTVRSYIKANGINCTDFYRHLWILRGDFNEISNCTFTGVYDPANVQWRGSTIYREATYNHVHHCTFSDYGSFEGNNDNGVVLEIGIDGSGTDGTEYNLIEYNTFAHGGHHVLGVHGNHNVIRYNTVRNDAWWPLSDPAYGNRMIMVQGDLPDGYRNLFEYNRIGYGGETSELDQIGGSGGTWSSPYHIVRRNVFMQCSIYGMYYSSYGMEGPHELKIYNNVFWHNGYSTTGPLKSNWGTQLTHAIMCPDSATSIYDNVFKNNIFYENKNELLGAGYPIVNGWTSEDGWAEPKLQIITNNWRGGIDGDPGFVDISGTPDPELIATQFDFSLQSDSGAIDNGEFLTTIISSGGSGTQFQVQDAGYFFDGWGLVDAIPTADISGDVIQLEGQTQKATIINIDYNTNTITVDTSLTWTTGQGVSLEYSGSAPDQGAYEYEGTSIPFCGNDVTEMGEACDGSDVNGYDCSTVAAGFVSGPVSCYPDCSGYDVSQCVPGNIIAAGSCNQADVQAAINSAQDGDTVLVPGEFCTWETPAPDNPGALIYEKSILLKGAGMGKTIINDSTGVGWDESIIFVTGIEGKPVRITGFTFLNITDKAVIFNGTLKNWRIDHCDFVNEPEDFGGLRYIINTEEDDTYGVIDHNNFTNSLVHFQNDDIPAWDRPLALGTAIANYVEDNRFYYGIEHGSHEDFCDAEAGARLVVRYNNITNAHFHIHGNDGGSWRSTHSWEFYNNLLFDENINNYRFAQLRGGTGVVFNNNATGNWGPIYVTHNCVYRSDCYEHPSGDFTQDCTEYPCTDQIGRTTDHDNDSVQDLVPVFEWENYVNGIDKDIQVQADLDPMMVDIIQENRDFYNDAVTFDHLTGIYSAEYTDDDNSTKQWVYKPYVYPHPLTLIEPAHQTYHRSDTNQDGCIDTGEMVAFMDRWKISSQDVTMPELMESIGLWKAGIGC